MRVEDCFYFGKIVRKHSYKGEVVINLEPDFSEIITELESVWLLTNNQLVPFFIEKLTYYKNYMYRIQFEGLYSEAESDKIIGNLVYLSNEYLPKSEGDDLNVGTVGKVMFVNVSTPQTLLEVDNGTKMVFIPAHEAFIRKIDKKKKIITVETPEGLLDL
jgi:16S rRNA processing protein RimM